MTGQRRDCACPRARHEHGTRQAYQRDACRCDDCRAAHRDHARERRMRHAQQAWNGGSDWTNPEPTVTRLRALAADGWTLRDLAQMLGTTYTAVWGLRHRDPGSRVLVSTARRVRDLYESLDRPQVMTQGRQVARLRALRRGWLPSLALDDDRVDDPDCRPETPEPETPVLDEVLVERYMTGQAHRATYNPPPERLEAIRRLADCGMNDAEIGRRLGMKTKAVAKERTRHGIPAGTPREAA